MPTRNPSTDSARPSDCETRLKRGAQAHKPPTTRITAAGTTIQCLGVGLVRAKFKWLVTFYPVRAQRPALLLARPARGAVTPELLPYSTMYHTEEQE